MDKKHLLDFLTLVGRLKETERTGWKVSGVKSPESVSDHTWRTALMTFIIGRDLDLDLNKSIKLALVHDIAEAITGDIVTWNNHEMTKEKKLSKEKEAVEKIRDVLGGDEGSILDLLKEYMEGRSKEARFVAQVDKLEMILQAMEYKKDSSQDGLNKRIDTFFKGESPDSIEIPVLIELLGEIKERLKGKDK